MNGKIFILERRSIQYGNNSFYHSLIYSSIKDITNKTIDIFGSFHYGYNNNYRRGNSFTNIVSNISLI